MQPMWTFMIGILCAWLCGIVYSEAYIENRPFGELNKRYCRVRKQCTYYAEKTYDYRHFTPISDIKNGQPNGYLVRLAFYVLADRDAHIMFTTNDHPIRPDDAYEILIGGYGNTRTFIRRKRQDADKAVVDTMSVLSAKVPLKVLIEIGTDGTINVFIEHSRKVLANWKDPSPLPIKYFGFSSYDNSLARYFYNCDNELRPTVAQMQSSCKHTSATDYSYKEFVPLGKQTDGYIIDFPVYVLATRDAHILFAPEQKSDEDVYEILIGGWGNTRVLIRRRASDAVLVEKQFDSVFEGDRFLTVLIRLTTGGELKVYGKLEHTQYIELASTIDSNPIPVRYVSFASWQSNPIDFHYDCSMPWPALDVVRTIPLQNRIHPLLNDPPFPPDFDKRNILNTKCSKLNSDRYEYSRFIPLSDISNSRPAGYIARIALYIQGPRDGHVLLCDKANPTATDAVYEFLIGGWANTRVLIRRKLSNEVLNTVDVINPINDERPTKIVIEITNRGHIRVYTEANTMHPIASAYDPHPLTVQYVSFASWVNANVQFFYNCGF